jgi:hypothetical protein
MFTLEQDTKAEGGIQVQLYSFLNLGARWGGWVANATPGLFNLGKETRDLFYIWLGGPHGSSGRVRKNLPPPR